MERSKDELARAYVDHSDGLQGFIVTALEGQLVGHLAANRRLVADVVHLPGAHPETGSRAQRRSLVQLGDGREVEKSRQLGKPRIEAQIPLTRGDHAPGSARRGSSRPTVGNSEMRCWTAADSPPRWGRDPARTDRSSPRPWLTASANVLPFMSFGSSVSTHPLSLKSRARVRCSALGPGRGINKAGVDDRRISIVVL